MVRKDCTSCLYEEKEVNEKPCSGCVENDNWLPVGVVAPLDVQHGGDHYKNMPIQPVEFIHKNGVPFIEGCVIKYVVRWRNKNGIEDLKKAKHFLELLIAMEEK